MQCVILAGGKGKRLRPLTNSVPKPLVKVDGKPLLDHIVEALPEEVTELIIVHGYLGDVLQDYCGDIYHGLPVTYVEQKEQKGTGHALWLCKDYIKDRFLYLFADDLHGSSDLKAVVGYERAMLVLATDTPERFGIVECNDDNTMSHIIEKPTDPPSNLASTGVFVLDKHIFDFPPEVESNGEFYHTDMINRYVQHYPIQVVEQKVWIPVGYPEDIEKAESYLQNNSL